MLNLSLFVYPSSKGEHALKKLCYKKTFYFGVFIMLNLIYMLCINKRKCLNKALFYWCNNIYICTFYLALSDNFFVTDQNKNMLECASLYCQAFILVKYILLVCILSTGEHAWTKLSFKHVNKNELLSYWIWLPVFIMHNNWFSNYQQENLLE